MLQFPLRALFFSAVVVAVGCAALIHPTEVWRQAMVTMTVLILMVSTLGAIFGHGGFRVSAGGLAIAGWLYFLLAFAPSFNVREHLLTSQVLDAVEKIMPTETEHSLKKSSFLWDGDQLVSGSGSSTIRLWDLSNHNDNFHCIGHALWALIVGVIGSLFSGWFFQRPKRDP